MTGDPDRRASAPDDLGAGSAGSSRLEQSFDADSLYALRAAVAAHAAATHAAATHAAAAHAAGPSHHWSYDVIAVAHELAANAVVHGAGHGRLRLWAENGYLYCQVSDDGPDGRRDAASRHTDDAAPWPAKWGHGLWLARQVADEVSIEHHPAGTTVTARFALPA